MVVLHHRLTQVVLLQPSERPLHERKISAPAARFGRRSSQVVIAATAQRRSSVAGVPRRMGRRGSEVRHLLLQDILLN